MANRGLKRLCTSCGVKFYDMAKTPIICPSCSTRFTGEVQVTSRRSRSTIVPDTVKRDEIEAKNKEISAVEDDDDTVSLEEVEEDNDDDDADNLDSDMNIDDIDGDDAESDDDLSDLNGDIAMNVDDEKDH